jgi:hypothetical protein
MAPRRPVLVLAIAALVGAAILPTTALAAPPAAPGAKANAQVGYIVRYHGQPGKKAERAIERLGGKVKHHLKLVDGLAVDLPPGQLKQLKKDPAVDAVEVDATITAFSDFEYDNAWGVKRIGSERVHQTGNTGQGVKVAIIDTGIDYIHNDPDDVPYVVDPEFNAEYKGGYDFYNNDNDPLDDNGHGTHVAGILAAEHNGYLVVGVAPGVDLYALKVLSAAGEGDYSGLIAALGWAVDHHMDVVNMSLGGHEASAALQDAIAAAYDAGVTLVAASGNVNPGNFNELLYGCPVAYPAAYDQVIAVSFTNTSSKLTGLSCTGTQVDFAAPGDQIFSAVPQGPTGSCMFCTPYGYAAESGTSMASPHVAGVVALVLHAGIADANDDGLLADDVKAHLCATTSPAAGMLTTDSRYPKWYGCGIIDAGKALVDVPPPPPAPGLTAAADSATVAEDGSTTVAVLANDTDPAGGPITVTAATDPPHGTATVELDGTITYAPDADYNGPDSFGYTITNPAADSATGTVSVTVTPVNDPPVAVADTLVTSTNTAASIAVLANDRDIDGDTLAVTGVGAAAHGNAVVNADGSVTYTPSNGYSGSDAFSYAISDGAGGTASGSVSVSIVANNTAPVAVDDTLTTAEDTAATIDVVGNDTDADGGPLTATAVSQPAHGTTAIDGSGRVVYTPAANYHGPDAFGYTVADAVGATDTAAVTVTVTAANDPPVAVDDTASTTEDTLVSIPAVGNDTDVDGDALAVSAVTAPAFGTAVIQGDGTIGYTPAADYSGSDTFSYTVSDGAGGTDTGIVTVNISAVNDVPLAANKTATTPYGTAVTVTLTGSDVETCDLTFQVLTPPAHGTVGTPSRILCVTLLPPYADSSKIVYTPAAGFSGSDSFTYRTSDGSQWSAPATVAITVNAPTLLHAGDLDGTRTIKSSSWTATMTVKVHNAGHAIVSGVTVTGVWSNGATGTVTCKTSSAGTCSIAKSSIPKTTASVTFTVTGMTLKASVYDGAANHDPETDSTGTAIVIRQQ